MTANSFKEFLETCQENEKVFLNSARQSLPMKYNSDEQIIRLFKASKNSEHFNLIIRYLYQDLKERPTEINSSEYFFQTVDQSTHGLEDWIKAIFVFNEFIESEKRKTKFKKMIGFISCCEESSESKESKMKLEKIVIKMLNEFGFQGP